MVTTNGYTPPFLPFLACDECGALVPADQIGRHEAFHERIDQIARRPSPLPNITT